MRSNKKFNYFEISIVNDSEYVIEGGDNLTHYSYVYGDAKNSVYFPSKHGVILYYNGNVHSSAIVVGGGGATGVHDTGSLIDGDRFLICCGDNVFCLGLPRLDLQWNTQADTATCFEIFKYKDSYIVHGEMEISRLNQQGKLVWQFGGADIFTSVNGKDLFEYRQIKFWFLILTKSNI